MEYSSNRSTGELVRWTFVICFCMLAVFTMSALRHVQYTIDVHSDQNQFTPERSPLFWLGTVSEKKTIDYFFRPQLGDVSIRSQNNSREQQAVGCIDHPPMTFNASGKRVSDPTVQLLEQSTGTVCGELRRNWRYNPPLSNLAQNIFHHQSNCSMPVANNHMDNMFGFGSHMLLWSQSMCNAMEDGYRIRTHQPEWLWLDQHHCDMEQAANQSPMLCYFPQSEYRCSRNEVAIQNVTDPRDKRKRCKLVRENNEHLLGDFRAASMEYLFQSLSPLIIQEAQRQIGLIFQSRYVPEDLICVHIRWGDKFFEMELASIEEYIDAINQLTGNATTANIYLATEDPKALNEFLQQAPSGWKVYHDITITEINAFRPVKGNRASYATKNTKGRAGLVALGSLLVGLEAKSFVLTTKSNWSALINYLRTNIIDPRCDNCTQMIDLRPGVW